MKSSDEESTPLQREDLPPPPQAPQEWYMVALSSGDGFDPVSWPRRKKLVTAAILIAANFVVIFGSAVLSPGTAQVAADFHVGSVVATLGAVSLFVAGFATGPILFGPLSEMLGRKIPLLLGVFLFDCFSFAVATCKDVQTFSICRFFMGVSGACIITVVPAAVGDLFGPDTRPRAMTLTVGIFMSGPMIAPIVGGYIVHSYLRWRWCMYLCGIMTSALGILMILFMDESYAPVVAREKAVKLREETGLWPLYAPIERQQVKLGETAKRVIVRPLILLGTEPILTLISLYLGFTYGLQYLSLSAVPIIFGERYGWPGGNQFLAYISMLIGNISVTTVTFFVFNPMTQRRVAKQNGKPWPEGHLLAMLVTSVSLPVGLFLFTWSGNYKVMWVVPCVGLAFMGVAFVAMFLGSITFITETFHSVAASAVAANVFLRSGIGCSMPIYASIMFHNLGDQWAGTLLGCLGVVLAPIPICFFIFGPTIRKWSKNAVKDEDMEMAFKDVHENPATKIQEE